jgi:hypothetical protein
MQDINGERETGNGKPQSGSKLPHSESALRAQCCGKKYAALGETPALPGIKIKTLWMGKNNDYEGTQAVSVAHQ